MAEEHNPEDARKELSARELVSVLVRFLAVTTTLGFIASLVNFSAVLIQIWQNAQARGQSASTLLLSGGAFLVTLVVAAGLWLFPEAISDRIVPEEYDGYIRFDLSFREIQALVVSLLGLYVLSISVPLFARVVIQALVEYPNDPTQSNIFDYFMRSYGIVWVQPVVEVVFGILLMVWSRGIVKAVYYGFSPDEEEEEDESSSQIVE